MAKVKMCDACGRIYIRNNRFDMHHDGGHVCGIRTVNSAGRADVTFDLCDDCLEKLYDWLAESRKDPAIYSEGQSKDIFDIEKES